jgi:hypothetical protein
VLRPPLRLEVLAAADVGCVSHEEEANGISAFAALGEHLAGDASDVVSIGMLALVKDRIDSGLLHFVARLECIGHSILFIWDRKHCALWHTDVKAGASDPASVRTQPHASNAPPHHPRRRKQEAREAKRWTSQAIFRVA